MTSSTAMSLSVTFKGHFSYARPMASVLLN